MAKLKEGDRVFWNDPDDGIASGYGRIVSIKVEKNQLIDDDTIIVLSMDGGSEAEVLVGELGVNVIARVRQAMESDDESELKQNWRIAEAYQTATPKTRKVVDDIFIALCGWSLKTILAGEDGIEES